MNQELPADGGPNSPARIYGRLFVYPRPDARRVLAVIWATVDRDRVVAEGTQKVRPGMHVNPKPFTANATGR